MSDMDADTIISQYVLSSWMIGARFGDKPFPGYIEDTVRAIRDDLRGHGYDVVAIEVAR